MISPKILEFITAACRTMRLVEHYCCVTECVSASVMIGAEVEASFLGSGGKATIEVTAGVAYTGTTAWGGEQSTSKAKAPGLKIPVKNGQTAVIYEVVHEYKFTRTDGTEVPQYAKKEVDGATGFQAAFYPENK